MKIQIAAVLMAFSVAVQSSELLYEQAPADAAGVVLVNSNNLANYEGSEYDVQAYDNFKLPKIATVGSVCWRGQPSDAQMNGFIITFYPSSHDRFSGPDLAKPLGITWIEGAGDEVVLDDGLSDYQAVLADPVKFNAEEQYWLSVVAVKRDFSPWGWSSSRNVDSKSLQMFNEMKVQSVSTDRAFCLKQYTEAAQ